MPYTISFDKDNRIVDVQISGAATREEHYAALDEAMHLCQENECSKLLVDLRELVTTHFSTTRCFVFGQSVTKRPSYVQIAHVMPTDAKSREDVRFVSTVETNRGVSSKEFDAIDDARKWLLGEI